MSTAVTKHFWSLRGTLLIGLLRYLTDRYSDIYKRILLLLKHSPKALNGVPPLSCRLFFVATITCTHVPIGPYVHLIPFSYWTTPLLMCWRSSSPSIQLIVPCNFSCSFSIICNEMIDDYQTQFSSFLSFFSSWENKINNRIERFGMEYSNWSCRNRVDAV